MVSLCGVSRHRLIGLVGICDHIGAHTYHLDHHAQFPPRRVLAGISDLGPGRAWAIGDFLFWSPTGRLAGSGLGTDRYKEDLEHFGGLRGALTPARSTMLEDGAGRNYVPMTGGGVPNDQIKENRRSEISGRYVGFKNKIWGLQGRG